MENTLLYRILFVRLSSRVLETSKPWRDAFAHTIAVVVIVVVDLRVYIILYSCIFDRLLCEMYSLYNKDISSYPSFI